MEPLTIGFILFLDRDTSPAVALYLFPSGLCGSVLPFVSYFETLKKTNSTFVCEIVADVCFSPGSRQQFCGMMEFKKTHIPTGSISDLKPNLNDCRISGGDRGIKLPQHYKMC